MAGFGKKARKPDKSIDDSFKDPPKKKEGKKRPSDFRDNYAYKSENIWRHSGGGTFDDVKVTGRHFDYFKPLPNKNAYPENSYKEINYNDYLKLTSPNYTCNVGTSKLMDLLKHRFLTSSGKLRKNMLNLRDDEIYLAVALLEEAKEAKRVGKGNLNISYQEKMFLEDVNKRSK